MGFWFQYVHSVKGITWCNPLVKAVKGRRMSQSFSGLLHHTWNSYHFGPSFEIPPFQKSLRRGHNASFNIPILGFRYEICYCPTLDWRSNNSLQMAFVQSHSHKHMCLFLKTHWIKQIYPKFPGLKTQNIWPLSCGVFFSIVFLPLNKTTFS